MITHHYVHVYIIFLILLKYNRTALKLCFRYGNTYSLTLGGEHLIFLSEYDTMKEAFNKDSNTFRPLGSKDFRRAYADYKGGDGDNGIVDSHTTVWKEQRRFALQHLKLILAFHLTYLL